MNKIINLIEKINFYQKFLLNISLSIFSFWFLDGFGFKPLEDIVFKFLNIVFSWSFDSEFGLLYKGYLHPDFIFIFCLIGLFLFKKNPNKINPIEDEKHID